MGSKVFKDSSSLRIVSSGSASLPTETANRLAEVFGSSTSIFYALTEMQPEIYEVPGTLQRPGSVGRAWGANMRVGHVNADSDIGEQHSHIQFCEGPEEVGEVLLKSPAATMRGYKNTDKDEFVDGWFRTGDMGTIDADGYLFLTGRSKEVINRGGETISPFEVENEAISHPDVVEAMAFSARHPILQETVGIAIVTKKEGDERPSLSELNKYFKSRLHPSKVPQMLVYMDDLPKSGTRKLLRIKFAERCDLPEWDHHSSCYNTYEAVAIPVGMPLDTPITCYPADGQSPPEEEEEEDTLDSLGFTIKRGAVDKGLQEMEMRVRDNCYVYFVTGILIDHFYSCYFFEDGSPRQCGSIQGIEPLSTVLSMFGDSKCQLGMMMVAGYFHSLKGRAFTPFVAALALVYLFMYCLYPYFSFLVVWLIVPDDYEFKQLYDSDSNFYAFPRWFLLCILFPRYLTGGFDLINQLVFRCSTKAGEVMEFVIPWFQIALMLVLGLFWKGTGEGLCNSMPDSFKELVCYKSPATHHHGILWPAVCMMSTLYLVCFFYAGPLVKAAWESEWALQLSGSWKLPQCCQQLGAPRKLKYSKVIAFIVACLFVLSCWLYNTKRTAGFDLGTATYKEAADAKSGNYFDADESTVWIIQDFLMQTLQAFMFVVMMSQVPFHLSWLGASTLGAFVYQILMFFFIYYGGLHILLYRIAGIPPTGANRVIFVDDGAYYTKPAVVLGYHWNWMTTLVAFCVQLFVVFGAIVVYWFSAALFFHPLTMLPFNLPYWIYTRLKDRFSVPNAKDTQSQSNSGTGAGSGHTESTPLLTEIISQ